MSPMHDDELLDATLLSFLDDEAARVDALSGVPSARTVTTRVARRLEGPPAYRRPLAVAGVLAFVLLSALWLSAFRGVDTRPSGLLEEVITRGFVRIAIREDFPQSVAAGLGGFDLDVANELSRRLGVRPELAIRLAEELTGPAGLASVDLALPSDGRTRADDGTVVASTPYYHWPVFLVVAEPSTATTVADVDGGTVCAVEGSAGADWLEGSYAGPSSTPVEAPPRDILTRLEAADRDCVAALLSGEVDALITTTLSPADLAVRPVRTVGEAVLTDPRSILAQRAGIDFGRPDRGGRPRALRDAHGWLARRLLAEPLRGP